MDKMKLAHDWAMKYGSPESFKLTVDKAWKYADAMQAEADKRSISLTKDKDGNCLHFHREFGHARCMDCGASLDEQQPYQDLAPNGFDWWAVDKDNNGNGWFYETQPTMMGDVVCHYCYDYCNHSDDYNHTKLLRKSL